MICTIISNEPGELVIRNMSDYQIGFYLEMMGYEYTAKNVSLIRKMDDGDWE